MPVEPLWISLDEVLSFNLDQIEHYGGASGVRDAGLIESAVNNPINAFHYEGEDDLLALAVRLCVAIARNHGFVDGNKRTAAVTLIAFLARNGYILDMPDNTILGRMLEATITRDMSEEEFADFLDQYLVEF